MLTQKGISVGSNEIGKPATTSQPEEGVSGLSPMSIASAASPQQSPGATISNDSAPAASGLIKFGLDQSTSGAEPAFSEAKIGNAEAGRDMTFDVSSLMTAILMVVPKLRPLSI